MRFRYFYYSMAIDLKIKIKLFFNKYLQYLRILLAVNFLYVQGSDRRR